MSNIFFTYWQLEAGRLRARAERLSKRIIDEARQVASQAGLDPSAPFQSAHNWEGLRGVDDGLRRKVLRLEQLSFEPGRIVSRINERTFKRATRGSY